MIDLEREVREVLEQRAEEAAGRAGDRMAPEIRSRVRRRQAGTLLLAGALAATISLMAFAGVRQLSESTGFQPGEGPSVIPSPDQTYAVVTTGEIGGKPWRLSVSRRGEDWCTRVEVENGASGGCGLWAPEGGFNTGLGHHRGYPVGFLTGQISKDVSRVVVRLENGDEIDPEILEPPDSLGAPFNVFVALLPNDPQTIIILGYDRQGNIFHRARIEPAEPPAKGFIELGDAYGNVVGYIPASNPLWHEWAEPGTPATIERIESIRHVAGFPLEDVWLKVRTWWENRPPADGSDDAFLDWWAAYPVTRPENQ